MIGRRAFVSGAAPIMVAPLLDRIWWEERWLALEAEGDVDLPAYTGATLRGALGSVMRRHLCDESGQCGERCRAPGRCRFFSLFEQARAEGGAGPNIPKPLILEPPLTDDLRRIALGGAITHPFTLSPGRSLPVLSNAWRIGVRPGGTMRLGLRGLGVGGAALDGVVEGVRRDGLEVKGGRLRLTGIGGGKHRFSAMPPVGTHRVRISLTTPTILRSDDGLAWDPEVFTAKLLEQVVVRAVSVVNVFFANGGERVPFVKAEWPGVIMTGSRLFRYILPRRSYRQGKWMNFDGVVGWMEWEGEVASLLPWLRAAEVLHVGQKATFGLGRLEIASPLPEGSALLEEIPGA